MTDGIVRRRYPKRQKLATIMAVEMSTLTEVSESTGIPATTISYWMHRPEFAEVRSRTRENMAEEVTTAAHLALDRLVALLPTMEGRDVVFALEKTASLMQLMTGRATERVESRDISDTLPPDMMDALSDEIDAWMAERKAELTPEEVERRLG